MATRTLSVVIAGDPSGAQRAFQTVGDSTDTMATRFESAGRRMRRVGRQMTLGVTLPIVAGFGLAVQAAAEEEASMAQLDQALLKNLGMTKQNREEVEKQITSWQNMTGFADDQLRPALGNLVRAGMDWKTAQDTMGLAMDIARAKGLDLETVTKAIGRAADGNVGALGRLGIKTKNAAGETMSFDEIMQNAADTMGGSASRHADTAAGKMDILRARFDDAKESLGKALLPVLAELGEILSGVADWFEKLSPKMQKIIIYAGLAAAAIGPLAYVLGALATVVGVLMSPITLVVLALAAIVTAAYLVWTNWDTIWTWIKEHPAIAIIVSILAMPVAAFITIIGVLKWLYENWDSIWNTIKDVTGAVVDAITAAWSFMGDVFSAVYNNVIAPVLDALGFVLGLVKGVIETLVVAWQTSWDTMAAIIGPIVDAVVGALGGIVGILKDIIEFAKDAIGWLEKIGDIGGKITNPGGKGEFGGILGFDTGGVVPGPIGSAQLAVVHGGETILPTHKGGGMGAQTVVIPVMIDGREVARAVWREDDERDRRRGR
jgi:phage-related minor tail protein